MPALFTNTSSLPKLRVVAATADAQSSSFVSYLIGKYGTTPFHAIYNKAVEDMDFEAAFGLPQDQLIGDWMAAIRQQPAPSEEGQRVYSILIQNIKNNQ